MQEQKQKQMQAQKQSPEPDADQAADAQTDAGEETKGAPIFLRMATREPRLP